MNTKLSVVISAFNEEKKIQDCLESVKWADEIIFIDNSSCDKTLEIAKKYTSKIFKRPNNPMLNINKNYGITKASGNWVLVLDADEQVSDGLKKEIDSKLNSETDISGYWIPRKNIIFDKWIQHSGWYPDYQLRLIKSGIGKFPEKHVHEMIETRGKTAYLKENLIHLNYETIAQFLRKHIQIYAPNEAQDLLNKGYVFSWVDSIRMPSNEFLSRYFAREGYKDGFHGLMLSLFMAFYHFVIFSYIWEKTGFQQQNNKMFFPDTEKEFTKTFKDMVFWFLNEKGKNSKNILKKFLYKSRKKISRI